MFELIFGIIWTIISFLILIFVLYCEADIYVTGFVSIFVIVGIYLIIKGISKLIKNYKTSKKGEECYGIIKNIKPTDNKVNGHPIYEVEVITYIESIRNLETISEEIGFKYSKYPIGTFVKLKYYNGDINILKNVEFNDMPMSAQYYLKDQKEKVEAPDDIVTINGVRYKRMD